MRFLDYSDDIRKSILSPENASHGGNCRAREPGVRANALATSPVIVRVPSKDLPLSALFSCLT